MLKSLLISLAILFCATILESSIFTNISFFIVVPDILLILSIYFSLLNGKLYGEITGFGSGLFLDLITGSPFGLNCLLRTIIGYVFGFFSRTVIISGLIMPVLSAGVGTIFKRLFLMIISFIFPSINLYVYSFISKEFLFEFCANIVFAIIIFKIMGFFKKTLSLYDTRDMINHVQD